MKRAKSKGTSLTLLGRSETKLPAAPSEARLETFPNPTRRNYHIHFETDDFTCLCPVTGQPDFARIDIDYVQAIVTAQFSARGGIALTVRAEYPDKKIGRDGG